MPWPGLSFLFLFSSFVYFAFLGSDFFAMVCLECLFLYLEFFWVLFSLLPTILSSRDRIACFFLLLL